MANLSLRNRAFGTDPFALLKSDMGRLFDRIFDRDYEMVSEFLPTMDLIEEQDALVVRADIPGVDPKAIDLSLDNGVLTIRGERHEEKQDSQTMHWTERRYGAFAREIRLPSYVDSDKIEASYKDGVLLVRLPKKEEAKPRQITIQKK